MSADEMFEKLGYIKDLDNELGIDYFIYDIHITFNKKDKTVQKRVDFDCKSLAKQISMQELQAINKKVEELGWNE